MAAVADNLTGSEVMQDKRRRDDFASTEVGEATGGRVTQQAFDEKREGQRNKQCSDARNERRREEGSPGKYRSSN